MDRKIYILICFAALCLCRVLLRLAAHTIVSLNEFMRVVRNRPPTYDAVRKRFYGIPDESSIVHESDEQHYTASPFAPFAINPGEEITDEMIQDRFFKEQDFYYRRVRGHASEFVFNLSYFLFHLSILIILFYIFITHKL
jgi:hypothetical protein